MNKTVVGKTLHGGTNDGERVYSHNFAPVHYAPKRLSIEEAKALNIDGVISWKCPDEVYVKDDSGEFHYSHTVEYKPVDETLTKGG